MDPIESRFKWEAPASQKKVKSTKSIQFTNLWLAGSRKYFLQANGQPLVNGEELSKGKFFWATEDISVTDKLLTLKAECQAGEEAPETVCKTAITTLMNLKIIQVDTRKLKPTVK